MSNNRHFHGAALEDEHKLVEKIRGMGSLEYTLPLRIAGLLTNIEKPHEGKQFDTLSDLVLLEIHIEEFANVKKVDFETALDMLLENSVVKEKNTKPIQDLKQKIVQGQSCERYREKRHERMAKETEGKETAKIGIPEMREFTYMASRNDAKREIVEDSYDRVDHKYPEFVEFYNLMAEMDKRVIKQFLVQNPDFDMSVADRSLYWYEEVFETDRKNIPTINCTAKMSHDMRQIHRELESEKKQGWERVPSEISNTSLEGLTPEPKAADKLKNNQ